MNIKKFRCARVRGFGPESRGGSLCERGARNSIQRMQKIYQYPNASSASLTLPAGTLMEKTAQRGDWVRVERCGPHRLHARRRSRSGRRLRRHGGLYHRSRADVQALRRSRYPRHAARGHGSQGRRAGRKLGVGPLSRLQGLCAEARAESEGARNRRARCGAGRRADRHWRHGRIRGARGRAGVQVRLRFFEAAGPASR